jgi:carboxypeptidase Taq
MQIMGINRDDCAIGETEHPFTNNTNKWDVRITTHYYEEDPFFSMYSVIHEGGHALYELDVRDDLQFTCLSGGVTMGVHESQSRFYENIIGRSRAFCTPLLKVMKEVFPEQMKGVTEEDLYSAVNLSKPSLIRTEADELTYSLHVMIRYELERAMIGGDLKVQDIPGEWNRLYREILGIDVPDDRRGCLQDSHWSFGGIGYFPSYALGSAYGVQMLREMEKTVDVPGTVGKGDLAPVTAWLTEKIHQYGSLKKPQDLLPAAMGGPLDATVYTGYLKKKFGELYHL